MQGNIFQRGESSSRKSTIVDRAIPDDATLTCGETRVDLTKNELKILQVLMENKEKIVSRDTLMTKLWESDSFVDENTLSVNVGRLRKKLDAAGLPDFILTKKGIGYHIG